MRFRNPHHLDELANPALKQDCAKTARIFPGIIGAKAPNAGMKARSKSRPAQIN
jgi:hypothetical protein